MPFIGTSHCFYVCTEYLSIWGGTAKGRVHDWEGGGGKDTARILAVSWGGARSLEREGGPGGPD